MTKEEIFFRTVRIFVTFYEYIQLCLKINELTDKKLIRAILHYKKKNNKENMLYHMLENDQRDYFFTEIYDKQTRLKMIMNSFEYSTWITEANNILEGKLDLLGQTIRIPQNRGWQFDPILKKDLPNEFYAFVKKKMKTICDVKYIWEINRHQYLIVLGKTYWITGEEKYAQKVVSIIENWIESNPYNVGVNWTSSLECAVRINSWIWAFFFCLRSKFISNSFIKSFFKSIFQHGRYIDKHLSYYSSPYNHLIGEAAALHMIGSLFSMFKLSRKWEKLGWTILKNNIFKQFHDDGMSVEQASFYHHFTLGFYLQAIFLRRNNGKCVSKRMLKIIEKALEISMHLTKPDGNIPMIGDIDNARSIFFTTKHSWNFSGFLSMGAILFNRSDFKFKSPGLCEEVIWIATDTDLNIYQKLESSEPLDTSIPFYKSGYYVFRDSWKKDSNYLLFDCGEISDGLSEDYYTSAAHGHADALSFNLVSNGKSFIIDGGFYTYFGNQFWHKYFRSEEAHNTVLIRNYRQAEYSGIMNWRKVKNPKLIRWESSKNYDAVTGGIIFDEGAYHFRQMISVKNHFWILRDLVKTPNVVEDLHSFLHFDPKVCLYSNIKKRELYANRDQYGLMIKYFCDSEVCTIKGGKKPTEGWCAPGYGIKIPSWCASFKWPMDGNFRLFNMLFVPTKNEYQNVNFLDKKYTINESFTKSIFSVNDSHFSVHFNQYLNTQFTIDKNIFFVDFLNVNSSNVKK